MPNEGSKDGIPTYLGFSVCGSLRDDPVEQAGPQIPDSKAPKYRIGGSDICTRLVENINVTTTFSWTVETYCAVAMFLGEAYGEGVTGVLVPDPDAEHGGELIEAIQGIFCKFLFGEELAVWQPNDAGVRCGELTCDDICEDEGRGDGVFTREDIGLSPKVPKELEVMSDARGPCLGPADLPMRNTPCTLFP
jgi:hypothetical protein